MIPKFNDSDFENGQLNDSFELQCVQCNSMFYRTKYQIKRFLNPKICERGNFCSLKCKFENQIKKVAIQCTNCNITIYKTPCQKTTINSFCSQSCAASYNNKNKTFGIRRSKIEKWIEDKLSFLYPNLVIVYNKKEAIHSELDIYIPSLNIAFELNGITHYKPIYGIEKFEKIRTNDLNKLKACQDSNIYLYIIDVSLHTYVIPKTSQFYLDKITKVINEHYLMD